MLAPGDDEYSSTLMEFGPAAGNKLSLPVVELMLRTWHQRDPEGMGAYVAEAIVGVPPKRQRKRQE